MVPSFESALAHFASKRSTLPYLTELINFCKRDLDFGGQLDSIATNLKDAIRPDRTFGGFANKVEAVRCHHRY